MAMVEAVLSLVVVSVMLVAALRTVGASKVGQARSTDALTGLNLAQDLMSEICDKAYSEPTELTLFGPEATEVIGGRTTYDDVDDYNGFSQSPPRDRANSVLNNLGAWGRSVDVAWVNPANLSQTVLVESGVKRITVTVTRKGVPMARLVAIRTAAGG
jgi:hypothetical protein